MGCGSRNHLKQRIADLERQLAEAQAEDAVGYEAAARYDAEQAQQEADHRCDVARDEEIVTEEPGPSHPNR